MRRASFPAAASADPALAQLPVRAGVGLRFAHHDAVRAGDAPAGWFEVHPENYLGEGVIAETLQHIRQDNTLSLHATGLSLGSVSGVDKTHLAAIAALADRLDPAAISDHLSWSESGGIHFPDLLPLPYTREALNVFSANIDRVQTALCRPILVENPSLYLAFAHNEMDEESFLAELARRTGCGVLLDINNVAVSAANLGQDASARLEGLLQALPAAAIGEIHLAGHTVCALGDGGTIRIDDHGSPVTDEVWTMFEATIRRIGPAPDPDRMGHGRSGVRGSRQGSRKSRCGDDDGHGGPSCCRWLNCNAVYMAPSCVADRRALPLPDRCRWLRHCPCIVERLSAVW
jgi:hypothetical protein